MRRTPCPAPPSGYRSQSPTPERPATPRHRALHPAPRSATRGALFFLLVAVQQRHEVGNVDVAPLVGQHAQHRTGADRKSVVWGKSVSVRVDLGGRRLIKKKKIVSARDSSN